MTIRGLGVAAVFLVGCAVGGVSSQLVVPKASAQQAATLTKWEYNCFNPSDIEELSEGAGKLGTQAWEMAIATNWAVCFKRPKM